MKDLSWESFFFKQQCGEQNSFEGTFDVKKSLTYDWIQSKVSIDAENEIHFLEINGFLFEDLKLTFDKTIDSQQLCIDSNINFREANEADVEQVQIIAKSVLPEKSRFVTLVGENKTAEFYSEWITKSIAHKFDDACYVSVTENGEVVGFITLKYMNDSSAQIGLLAISTDFQNHSIASMLLKHCEYVLYKQGVESLTVATEGKNLAAQRFYIKNKFNIKKIECWFYRK